MDSKNKYQTSKNKDFFQALSHAWDGLKIIFTKENNFKSHLVTTGFILVAGIIFQVGFNNFMWLLSACFLVLNAEVINTLFEYLVDLVLGNKYDPLAKKIKDVAAGGVLLTSLFAVIIGLIVFSPVLTSIFKAFVNS
ncbi:UDP kinase [Fructilactobacillus lindneri]|uniref:Diacylglycerol kinase n=1 Tax=Fructilactobacillus lindneri DSM 20690 = JCM 11027 TaxID=1122148 RepID=A0A0R2JP72_9LACO|nr:diacylglycerol kinase family protein [Fructilactobacillus lindneri]KRN78955.1 hypothetical protein IV52_GL000359 [Fructilactobacillus lindneri DSM 20690 = JCM 11027]POG98759.1 UDP kinase [Fructilactobacillus lindneri]POH07611.1 UDP kinase [Fructilactobacillus lindneri]POH08290.1 UDP kinase [Fructilactobacillus lindneri]POH08684.1 UDP kinase [Fructilactobacillus lindneri]